MRLAVAELMAQKGVTAYALARDSAGRISQSTAYRLADGEKDVLRLDEIAALCDILDVTPDELLIYTPPKGNRQ